MYLSAHDLAVSLAVAVASGVVALGVATLLGRSFMRNSRDLREVARAMVEGGARSPARPRTAELTGLAAELADVGERLATMRAEVEHVEAARRELVAWASHDLRTPLASIRAMVEALEDDLAPDPSRYHRAIQSHVDRLTRMVDDLLDVSRLDAGRLVPERAPVSVYDLVSDAVADFAPVAHDRGVALRVTGALESTVIGDAGLLARMLGNLVTNALQHAPSASVIEIAVEDVGGEVVLSVLDSGGGIDAGDLARVFEAGWRGDPSRAAVPPATGGAGAGLGLAIVRGIAEAHGGTASARSGSTGAQFEVRIPSAATSPPSAPQQEARAVQLAVTGDPASGTGGPVLRPDVQPGA
jgi:signal transduction histidine kinase